jgi:hypothetical protein
MHACMLWHGSAMQLSCADRHMGLPESLNAWLPRMTMPLPMRQQQAVQQAVVAAVQHGSWEAKGNKPLALACGPRKGSRMHFRTILGTSVREGRISAQLVFLALVRQLSNVHLNPCK